MHSACHASIFAFGSAVRLSVARLAQAAPAFAAPFAQHALSPANALDAVSIAMATRAVVVILIMMDAEIVALPNAFKLFRAPHCSSGIGLQLSQLPLQ